MHETVLLQSSARNRWPRQGRCSVVVINAVFVVNGLVTRRTRAPIPCTACSLEFSSWGDSDSGSVRPTYNSYWRTCSYLADTTVKELGVEAFRIIYLFTLPLLCLWYICINIFLCTFVPLVLLVQFSFFFSSVLFCSHLYISFKINLVCSRHDSMTPAIGGVFSFFSWLSHVHLRAVLLLSVVPWQLPRAPSNTDQRRRKNWD